MEGLGGMKLSETKVFLMFYIINNHGIKLGESAYLCYKPKDIEKLRNPDIVKHEVLEHFKSSHPEHEHARLEAWYKGDIIPLELKEEDIVQN